MHGHGITEISRLHVLNEGDGEDTSWYIPVSSGSLLLKFRCGLLVDSKVVSS